MLKRGVKMLKNVLRKNKTTSVGTSVPTDGMSPRKMSKILFRFVAGTKNTCYNCFFFASLRGKKKALKLSLVGML